MSTGNIAIIPARSGSKGVPDKNIKELCGKPLMAYSIEAARGSGIFDEIMVSTDSEKYAEIARSLGAEVPFLRSNVNALDGSNKWDAVEEVLLKYKESGRTFETFCVLQPTSPFRTKEDILTAYEIYHDKDAISVISVCETEHSPAWCNTLNEDLSMDGFISRDADSQRQKLEKYYRLNGAIYIVKISEFNADRYPYRKGSYAYIMPVERSIDIDSDIDFKLAEALIREKSGLQDVG